MLSNSVLIDIRSIIRSDVKLPHSRNNSIKIKSYMPCLKCKEAKTRGRKKVFDNCASLYQHLVTNHNEIDRDCYPSLENCVDILQLTSDLISMEFLK